MRATRLFSVLAVVGLGGACGDDTTGIPSDVEIYRADPMNGANELPTPVTSTATGRATITIMGNLLSWKVDVTGISNVTAGHIHRFHPDTLAGGVIIPLNPTTGGTNFTGTLAQGSVVVTVDSLLAIIRAGRAYVNIHTSANGGGEIRANLRRL
jgi:CHRD domain-containing protein